MKIKKEDLKSLTVRDLKKRKEELEYLVSRYNNLQLAKKVQLNSAYGAFGNKHFRYYDVRIAGSVTLAGQFVTRRIDEKINEYFNKILKTEGVDYVIFSHTDSMYIRLDGVVKKVFGNKKADPEKVVKALEKACTTKIYPKLKKIFEEIAGYINAFENKMNMKIEVIADRGVWTGKNRYALNIYYQEGTFRKHPKIKQVGKSGNIPAICREKIEKALEVILREDVHAIRKFVKNFKQEYMAMDFNDIAIPTSIKKSLSNYEPDGEGGKSKIYKKGSSKHIKGAVIYNHYIEKLGLEKDYKLIKEGDKIKFLTLKEPNPIHETVISYPDVLPSKLGLDDYIDKEAMFQICFMNPVGRVLKAAKWKLKEKPSLDSIFNWGNKNEN